MTKVEKAVFLIVAIIFVLMMSACGASVEERFDTAIACQAIEADCTEEWDDYNRGIEAQDRRDRRNFNPCPRGYFLYCDQWCSMTKMNRDEKPGICVRRRGFNIF